MKKRTAFIGAILSLIPLGQPLIIKTGVVLSTTGLFSSFSEKVHAGDNSYYFNRAYDKAQRGDYYGAISDYTKAIEINPNDSEAFYNRGNAKDELKDYYGAISDYTKAIEINPQYENAYNNRGFTKSNGLKDYYGAISDYTKAIEINPNYPYAYKNRGIAKELIGDLTSACSDWRQTIYLSPNDAAANWVRNQC